MKTNNKKGVPAWYDPTKAVRTTAKRNLRLDCGDAASNGGRYFYSQGVTVCEACHGQVADCQAVVKSVAIGGKDWAKAWKGGQA